MPYQSKYTMYVERGNKTKDIITTDYAFKGIRYPVNADPIKLGPDAALRLIELLQEHTAWTRHPLYQWGQRKINK